MTPTTIRHLVGAEWIAGIGGPLRNINPGRPTDVVAEGREATGSDVDDAFAAARAALPGWRRTPARARAAILLRAADAVAAHSGLWGAELAREEGKPLLEAEAEVAHAAAILRYHAHSVDGPTGGLYESAVAGERILVTRRPVGVIGAITPFNFPISIPAWKLAPALVWGNTVVWKPSAFVPVLAMRLAEALRAAGLPAGVLNLVHGGGGVGEALVAHSALDALTFTGSTAVGRDIAARLAARGVPFQGELGGKNASLVLDDADLDAAVEHVVAGAFRSAGQKCTATSRLVLHADIADDFIERLVARTRMLTVGDALDRRTDVGPLVNGVARDRVAGAIARAHGYARPVLAPPPYASGALAEGGFVAPSIFELPADDPGELWTREIFGPVVGILRASSLEHGIDLVNEGEYGLAAAVFTTDIARAMWAIDELRVGVTHVNSATAGADLHVPFGGSRSSALGPKEQGAAARDFFTETTTVYLRG